MGDFVADVTALYRAGSVTLPHAADYFGKAAVAVHKTALNDSATFTAMGDGSGTGQLQTKWTALRDAIQDQVLVRTQTSLIGAGEALAAAAVVFAEQDGVNGGAIQENIAEIDNGGNPADAPPPYVTPAPDTNAPHPEEQPQGPGI